MRTGFGLRAAGRGARPRVAALLLLGAGAALADAGSPLSDAIGDKPVGDALAAQVLDADSLKVLQPGNLQSALADLKTFDAGGKVAPGIAVEVTPFTLYFGKTLGWEEYQRPWVRILSQASLSLATQGQGSGAASVVRSAAAVRFRLIDEGDWRLNTAAIDCAKKLIQPLAPPDAPPGAPAKPRSSGAAGGDPADADADDAKLITEGPKLDAKTQAAEKKCFDDHTRWNGEAVAVGLAAVARSPGGDPAQTRAESWSAFASGSSGFGTERFNFALSARYQHGFAVNDAQLAQALSDLLGGGAQLAVKLSRLVLELNGGLGYEWDPAQGHRARGLLGPTLKLKLTDTLWIDLGATWTWQGGASAAALQSGLSWSYDVSSSG